ncbi:MAG: hypothetical protein JO197_05620 [Acidobacteria bacterium]|nr:hypothetical protein [Acidobacteriota bacterium]MBV9475984.1 hypothetical protein [Acidobacteriota bacterium]
MTHGDKAKAKDGKSSQASGKKSSTGKNGEGAGESVVKAAGKTDGKSSKAAAKTGSHQSSTEKQQAGSGQKGGSSSGEKTGGSAKAGSASGESRGKGRVPADNNGSFSNPVIGAAFKHAVKKYNNAFRRLTD